MHLLKRWQVEPAKGSSEQNKFHNGLKFPTSLSSLHLSCRRSVMIKEIGVIVFLKISFKLQ